jgi:hypothetical protein
MPFLERFYHAWLLASFNKQGGGWVMVCSVSHRLETRRIV